jgi:hypothetical protein
MLLFVKALYSKVLKEYRLYSERSTTNECPDTVEAL